MRLHICTGTVKAPVYIKIEMSTVNKCIVGTGYLSVMLLVSLYCTIFQLIQAFFLTLFYMFRYGLTVISYVCQVYLLHCLYILLVKFTD